MIRVHIICEGQTEETFIKELLYPTFISNGIHLIPLLLGGNVKFDRIRLDTKNRLGKEKEAYCTTFIDFYGLPASFPGKVGATGTIANKSKIVCDAMLADIASTLGSKIAGRFIPYVQMYEFEALLFSDPSKFATGINEPTVSAQLGSIRSSFGTPEEINNSPLTAPSKRVKNLVRRYDKPLFGSLAAIEIGLNTIRRECVLFNTWLETLEAL